MYLPNQILVSSPAHYAENMKKAEDMYKWCVKYCDDHPNFKGFEQECVL